MCHNSDMTTEARDIRKHVLPNGLVVITETMTHVRSVSVAVWIGNGSRREVLEETWLVAKASAGAADCGDSGDGAQIQQGRAAGAIRIVVRAGPVCADRSRQRAARKSTGVGRT